MFPLKQQEKLRFSFTDSLMSFTVERFTKLTSALESSSHFISVFSSLEAISRSWRIGALHKLKCASDNRVGSQREAESAQIWNVKNMFGFLLLLVVLTIYDSLALFLFFSPHPPQISFEASSANKNILFAQIYEFVKSFLRFSLFYLQIFTQPKKIHCEFNNNVCLMMIWEKVNETKASNVCNWARGWWATNNKKKTRWKNEMYKNLKSTEP